MNESISVNKAIERGNWILLNLPLLVIGISIMLAIYLFEEVKLDVFIPVFTIVLCIILSRLYWCFAVTKWKIWAFENVRNVHELKQKAIQNHLITKDGSWWQKTEIVNFDQKQKLEKLERKFKDKDVFYDDKSIPKETIIYFSKAFKIMFLLLGVVCFVAGSFSLKNQSEYYISIIIIAVGIYFIYKGFRISNNEPQITLNSTGIKIPSSEIMSWKNITNDYVKKDSNGKYIIHLLCFDYQNHHFEIEITKMNTTYNKIENLLQVYRVRYEKNNLTSHKF